MDTYYHYTMSPFCARQYSKPYLKMKLSTAPRRTHTVLLNSLLEVNQLIVRVRCAWQL